MSNLVPSRRRVRRLSVASVAAASLAVAVAVTSANTADAATTPTYTNYAAPSNLKGANDAGEPSIGSNWATGAAMYQSGLQTYKVTFDNANPPAATWSDVSSTLTSTTSLDPILFTDHNTNRTFVSQLSADCSLLAFTDNDGASWTQNPVGCGLAAGADHQTVGGGPFATGGTGTGVGYKDATYYCAQAIATAQCSLSNNGGLSFNPAVPIYNATQCGGLHGHVQVAPNDGAAYVPNADCGGKQGFSVSSDNGTTWAVRTVPGSSTQDESDPAIGFGSAGKVYLGFANGNGHPTIATTSDKGVTWSTPKDVGAAFGIQNTQFPRVIAGDNDRAAFAFLGTPTGGDDQSSSVAGVWHLYIATTYDGGATWTTVDATPTDPVQRGCIWLGGGSNTCRNLLDFMGSTVDKTGHVLIGYADGCIGTCVSGGTNNHDAYATIARQTGGTGLFAAYDATGPQAPAAPSLSATPGDAHVDLSWTAPSDNGSTISGYKVYRGTSAGGESLLTTVGGTTLGYQDTAVTNGTTYYYRVSAVNGVGEGALSNEVAAKPQAPSAPSAPQSLTASTVKGGNNAKGVKLAWQAPASTGTSAVTNYRIYRGTSSGTETLLTTVGNVLSYTDTATTSNVRYYYKVSAVNSVGESALSNEASAAAK